MSRSDATLGGESTFGESLTREERVHVADSEDTGSGGSTSSPNVDLRFDTADVRQACHRLPTDTDLLSEVRRRLPAARDALERHKGNIPSTGAATRASGTSDRTGSIACKSVKTTKDGETTYIHLGTRGDEAWRDDAELDRLELLAIARLQAGSDITATLQDILRIVDRWAPTDQRRQVLEDGLRAAANGELNYRGDINNCRSCARIPGQWGDPHRQGLCKRCDRALAQMNELYHHEYDMPPRELLERCKGRYIRNGDIINAMNGHKRR